MRILSNGFPTNMPNSENVSQGGPANFTKLFVGHIISNHKEHEWIGVMFKDVKRLPSDSVRLQKVFSTARRSYYCLRISSQLFRMISRAKSNEKDPGVILKKPIERLAAFVKKQKPDVVFLNGFGIFNWMLLKAAETAGAPMVIQHAGIWAKEIDMHKNLYTEHGRKLMKDMERDSTRLAQAEIFLNAWSKDYYQRNVAAGPKHKTLVIPLPFDFTAFRQLSADANSALFAFNKKIFHIGTIARWDKLKNHKMILGMAKVAKKRALPWKFHSVVAIPDSKEHRKTKKEYEKYVNVIPPIDRVGISNFCKSVDLLVSPSLFDVSPTVVLEALATDTPIMISPNTGYVHDFYSHGGKSWVINPRNAKAAIRRVSSLLGKRVPSALKKQILSKHDHKKVLASYLGVFAKTAQSSTASAQTN